ncbi:MAG TPA: 50S ribosomal protein L11 methyltransferase [Bdellovibrionota bacterium]|jgi:ribosomal protein L11 methyltransferase|nr:50S ribosomal protein L11 methyltransferase [Bdellovibrionota bacterium]
MSQKWIVKCTPKSVEHLMAALWDCPGMQGIVEADASGEDLHRVPEDFEVLEFGSRAAKKWAEYIHQRPLAAHTFLHVYLDAAITADQLSGVEETLKKYRASVEGTETLEEKDYLQAYRDSVRGYDVGETLWVGPPWASSNEGRRRLVVEPGLAFGTGDHPTTQLILEWMEQNRTQNFARIYDLGTGSGVLATGAQVFWPAAELTVSDNDPACRAVTVQTAELSGVKTDQWRMAFGDHEQNEVFAENAEGFDLVVSNIYAEVLLQLMDKIETVLKPGGVWVASGILEGKRERQLIRDSGLFFQLLERRTKWREHLHLSRESGLESRDEEWVMLAFQKRP